MTQTDPQGDPTARPILEPVFDERRWSVSPVWLVPAIAAAVGLWLLFHAWAAKGPEITIRFRTAEGMIAGKTLVKYKDVVVGKVSSVELTEDGAGVVADVALSSNAKTLATAGTRFWVVRPRLGVGGLSGVDTILSGAYIAADRGAGRESERTFIGLETPPTVINGTPGHTFVLHAEDLGSLDVNSPVYFRRVQVGRIASYALDDDGKGVTLQVFVDAPYDRFVTPDTRFWNASGVDIALGATGIKVNTQSLATVVAGGIAFANPASDAASTSSQQVHYVLANDRQTAMNPPKGPSLRFELRFAESLRGLSLGAPVYFAGVEVGSVASVSLAYDPATHRFPTVVMADVFPSAMGNVLQTLPKARGTVDEQAAAFLGVLVANGLRAQARTGNLLTGQLYVSLDFVPNAAPVRFDASRRPVWIPTTSGGFDHIEDQVASILGKLDKMPLAQIGQHLDTTLVNLDQTIAQVNHAVLPQATKTLAQAQSTFEQAQNAVSSDGPLQQRLMRTLDQLSDSARSLRTLTDLLSRHPEALVRGLKPSPDLPSSYDLHGPSSREPSK
ncbi:intermembrane transport protein PqiB [Trinickia dinghuensis]|uniref:MCE family protein n=1 Tax=Trinickia dinghuensis TaxID=2291023 RepID=A0A3D8K5W6_9BURK|nr:MlaD family protein [Trinickia dinghuensis]RDV00306.1 MCE family protein [Trinickia dinghuensis]